MKTLETKKAPAAIGPYSQAKMTGNFLFASGQIPVDRLQVKLQAIKSKHRQSSPART